MRRSLLPILLLLLSSTALLAEVEEEVFLLVVNGEVVGNERFTVSEHGDTLVLEGEIVMEKPQPSRVQVRSRVLKGEDIIIDYDLRMEETPLAHLERRGDSLHLKQYSRRGMQEKSVDLDGRDALPFDNAVAQHLWLLARLIERDEAAGIVRDGDELLAVIPQAMLVSELRISNAGRRQAMHDGVMVEARSFDLIFANVFCEVELDDEGRFMSMRAPMKGFELRRPGYRTRREVDHGPAMPEEALSFEGGGPSIPGTLTLPEGEGPFPTCLFLHGSGSVDRDMSLGPNKIFAQLARQLAARGIASLRYDKRTYLLRQQSGSNNYPKEVTLKEEVMDDALAAVHLLAGDSRVDPERLFLLGYDLGAAAAPTLSAQLADEGFELAGLVLLAPLGRDLLEVLMDQSRYLHDQGLLPTDQLATLERKEDNMRTGRLGEDDVVLFANPRYWDSLLFWQPWRDFKRQPAPALCLFGGRDFQINERDQAVWRKLCDEAPHEATRMHLLPALNHIFLSGDGPPGPAEYGRTGSLDPAMLDLIADWIQSIP